MLKLSKLADHAVVVLDRLSEPPTVQTAPGLARATGVPEPTVAKVLKALAVARLVISQRGARGGYRLARPLDQVSVADVVLAIDGPIALTACVAGANGRCGRDGRCRMRGRWDPVNEGIRALLAAITLADLQTGLPRGAHPAPAARVPPLFSSLPAA